MFTPASFPASSSWLELIGVSHIDAHRVDKGERLVCPEVIALMKSCESPLPQECRRMVYKQ